MRVSCLIVGSIFRLAPAREERLLLNLLPPILDCVPGGIHSRGFGVRRFISSSAVQHPEFRGSVRPALPVSTRDFRTWFASSYPFRVRPAHILGLPFRPPKPPSDSPNGINPASARLFPHHSMAGVIPVFQKSIEYRCAVLAWSEEQAR